jgi:exopolysaccharide production protein ExoY
MFFAGQQHNVGLPRAESPMQPVGGALKRALDIAVAVSALILLLPLLAAVAFLVRTTMGGPVLVRHTRVGFGGRAIDCYGFRTTETPAADSPQTSLGALLARSGIDKLPQLINVVRGEMSCVGPRPAGADELPQGGEIGAYLSARPGMTGTWQFSHGTPSRDEAAALNSAYVHNWSMQSDILILLKTIPAIVRVEGNRGTP